MIQQIYERQLDAILFSVNQYSDDILTRWISDIESNQEELSSGGKRSDKINNLLSYNPSLTQFFICDTIDQKVKLNFFSLDTSQHSLESDIRKALTQNKTQILQLIEYKNSGFQKVQALVYPWPDQLQCLVFITGNENQSKIVGLLINSENFIQDLVGPRLQVIARDQFVLSAFKKGITAPVYSTLQADTVSLINQALTKDLWVLPDYLLGIRTSGLSLQKIIDERTYTNLTLLILLDLILIIAVVLVFRNVKNEVQLAQNKADFVSNVSHEIRTPLALISMFAETLEMGRVKTEEKKLEYYSIISKEAHRLSGIVNKILNFSQTEANKKILNIRSVQVSKEIKEVLLTYDFHLKNKGFEYSFTEDLTLFVEADSEAFVEVFINLLDNAIKYSASDKRIEINTGRDNDLGFVSVKDHGIGISKMNQKHIFDKFYRVPSGDLAKTSGTGLGLSLVKQLMESQNGKISVESELEKGSRFIIYFKLSTTLNNG